MFTLSLLFTTRTQYYCAACGLVAISSYNYSCNISLWNSAERLFATIWHTSLILLAFDNVNLPCCLTNLERSQRTVSKLIDYY